MKKYHNIIGLLTGVIAGLLISLFMYMEADARMIKEYLGIWYVSTYSANSNTPSGTHHTASGAYATAGVTCAVDMENPLVPMGSTIEIEGLGRRKVQDVGGFGRYNGGRRAIDVFVNGSGFLRELKIWRIRPETKKEKNKRLLRERQKRQRGYFTLIYDPTLAPWQIITDPSYIKRGTVLTGYSWMDVVGTKQGLGNRIITGSDRARYDSVVKLGDVIEEAVG